MKNILYEKIIYTNPIDAVLSNYIREYDISKANINVLFRKGAINKKDYLYLYSLPKITREIKIGLMLRDNKEMSEVLKTGIIEAKKEFFEANDIKFKDVLSIKNDAIFLIEKIPTITKFDNIEFKYKNIYTSYYHLDKLELYYFNSIVDNMEYLHVKGINEELLKLHENYFEEFLKTTFESAQNEQISKVLEFIKAFRYNYISLQLPIGYYREFNNRSKFSMKQSSIVFRYLVDSIDENNKKYLDISYNDFLIRKLYSIYASIELKAKYKKSSL